MRFLVKIIISLVGLAVVGGIVFGILILTGKVQAPSWFDVKLDEDALQVKAGQETVEIKRK